MFLIKKKKKEDSLVIDSSKMVSSSNGFLMECMYHRIENDVSNLSTIKGRPDSHGLINANCILINYLIMVGLFICFRSL